MAIPSAVLDILNSLEVASLPAQVNAGDRLDLRLSPGLNAFDLLAEAPELFDIELNDITLDDVGIELDDINLTPAGLALELDAINLPGAGETEARLVLKSVEFEPLDPPIGTRAEDVDTNEQSTHALAHAIPVVGDLTEIGTEISEEVKGLIGKVSGTVRQVEGFSGGITGAVTGSVIGRIRGTIRNLRGIVKGVALLDTRPEVTVTWRVEDGNGRVLATNSDFVMLDDTSLENAALALMFLPVFAELSAGIDLISRRRIFCTVTVTVAGENESRSLGPIEILMPKIQLPTVLVMTEHAVTGAGYPGAVLVAVPSQSLLMLDQLTEKLREVQSVLSRLQTLTQVIGFGETIEQINRIVELVGNPSIRIPQFLKQDQVMDLWYVMREPGGFLGLGYKSWEDCISSFVMIGPPGRAVRFYNAKNFWERLGAFEIMLGAKAVAYVDDLSPKAPACQPTGPGGCTMTQRWNPPPASFRDIISSFQFLPLQ